MMKMIREINRQLRRVVIVVGAAAVIFAISRDKAPEEEETESDRKSEEFDDIW